MKKQQHQERSGVIRCQRCLKYGHYTYQCKNDVAYRYRPSRTVMYKEKIKLQLNQDKGPKTHIKDHDYKRVYVEDRPSSEEDEALNDKDQYIPELKQKIVPKVQVKETVIPTAQKRVTRNQGIRNKGEDGSSSSSNSSSSSSSSSSSGSSPEEKSPRKKRKV